MGSLCAKNTIENSHAWCAANFSFAQLAKRKSLGRSKPATNSKAQALQHTVWSVSTTVYPSLTELPSIEIN